MSPRPLPLPENPPARTADGRPPAGTPPDEAPADGRRRERAPRPPADDAAEPLPPDDHGALRSLLGAWALHACPPAEHAAVERHLAGCPSCRAEGARLREAVRWLTPADPLDLDPLLRARVLDGCLGRRPARVPVPDWVAPYTAETARLDALLASLNSGEWDTVVHLVWTGGSRAFTVAGVLGHLTAVDGLVCPALGLDDPLGPGAPLDPLERTEVFERLHCSRGPGELRALWRAQTHAVVRHAAFAGDDAGRREVDYGGPALTVPDSFLDRAFECWMHADDIARAVDYPYDPPAPEHLGAMIRMAARQLPHAVAGRRRQGLANSRARLVEAGTPGRCVLLEIEGPGGGEFPVALDSPAAVPVRERSVACIALDGIEFCHLTAGRRDPEGIAAGVEGDPDAVRDVLYAAASLSRL
ncbi:zf-HC2 domain-containing protein [Streptomyces capparidis]